ncbi:MAG: beta-lactamase family protein [Planctomycetes bacterium]|nr:beta-lactamase family protein [Planctomycetota bacterium]
MAPRHGLFLVALLLAVVLRGPIASAGDAPAVRDVSATLATIRAARDVPGLVAVTLQGDRIVAEGATGLRRRGGKEAITVADRMHLGSCTKAMTATLCAALVAEGKLKWDAKPAAVLEKRVRGPNDGWKDATLELLLQNRAGMPENLDADGLWGRLRAHRGPPREARWMLAQGVLGRPPVAAPGTKYLYSNAGFSVAGAMAEEATGTPYEDLLRKRLFVPLGMTTAGFGSPGTADRVDQPRGHGPDGTPVEPGPGADNPDAIAPAGKVHASLGDWAKFVSLHLRRGRGADARLAGIDFARLQTPPAGTDYAMGWNVTERPWAKGTAKGDCGRVLTHTGSNTMWYAVVWIAPERDFAVLAACNQGGDAAASACDDAASALIAEQMAKTK